MNPPSIRLYKLKGRRTWNADTKRPNGTRWQFATGIPDEEKAREYAARLVALEFKQGEADPPEPAVTAPPSPSGKKPSLADRLRNAQAAPVAPGDTGPASDDADDPEEPSEDGELIADILSMACTLGFQAAIGARIKRKRWRDKGRSGHYVPAPPNEKCVTGMQSKLRDRLVEYVGNSRADGWIGVGLYGLGVAITMSMGKTRVEDGEDERDEETEATEPPPRREERRPPAPAPEAQGDEFRRQLAERRS